MITLPLPDALTAILILHLSLVLLATLYYAIRRYRWIPRRHAAPNVFRCSGCGHVYLDRRNLPMSECDKCGTMNESVKNL